jgi:hypothetical protein
MKLSTTFIRMLTVVVVTVMLFTFSVRTNTYTALANGSASSYQSCSLPMLALQFVGAFLKGQTQPQTAQLPLGWIKQLSTFHFPWINSSKFPALPIFAKPQPTTVTMPWQNLVKATAAALHSCQPIAKS